MVSKQLSLAIIGLLSCLGSVARADDYSDRIQRMEQMQRQADDDRRNYSRLGRSETNYYASIAYSPATGNYGTSFSYGNLSLARRAALSRCGESDAKIVAWAKNCYCALAVGKDGYGSGYGSTARQAQTMALQDCAKKTTGGRIVKCVFSGSE